MEHFENLYTMDNTWDLANEDYFLESIPQMVTEEWNRSLTSPTTLEEIQKVIYSFPPDKVSGQDGFTTSFYHSLWDVIKSDLCRLVGYSFKTFATGGGINSSFLALIPNKSNPSLFSRFRLIFLCNVSYKIFSKLLVYHLKPLLPSLTSEI